MGQTTEKLKESERLLRLYDFEALRSEGIFQDLLKYCFTATYPPLKAARPTRPDNVFAKSFSGPLNVYLHFPFCSGRCSFCHFNVLTDSAPSLIRKYVAAIEKEISLIRAKLGRVKAASLYFGGGTPSLMSPETIGRLLSQLDGFLDLRSCGGFKTVEIHPEAIRGNVAGYFADLKKAGINRVSIGVQDFDPKVLTGTDRRHTPQEAQDAIHAAKRSGLLVNMDLLAPLPFQTLRGWQSTLRRAFELKPDSITLYTTSIRPTMPLYRQLKKHPFPDETTRFQMYVLAQIVAEEYGYEESRSRWFTPRSTRSTAEQLTSRGKSQLPTLGIGCGAYGDLNDIHYYNQPRMQPYLQTIQDGALPAWRGVKLSEREKMHREVILSIRAGALRYSKIDRLFAKDFRELFKKETRLLIEKGLATDNSIDLELTAKGKILSDEIAVMFASKSIRRRLSSRAYLDDSQAPVFEHLNHFYEIASP